MKIIKTDSMICAPNSIESNRLSDPAFSGLKYLFGDDEPYDGDQFSERTSLVPELTCGAQEIQKETQHLGASLLAHLSDMDSFCAEKRPAFLRAIQTYEKIMSTRVKIFTESSERLMANCFQMLSNSLEQEQHRRCQFEASVSGLFRSFIERSDAAEALLTHHLNLMTEESSFRKKEQDQELLRLRQEIRGIQEGFAGLSLKHQNLVVCLELEEKGRQDICTRQEKIELSLVLVEDECRLLKEKINSLENNNEEDKFIRFQVDSNAESLRNLSDQIVALNISTQDSSERVSTRYNALREEVRRISRGLNSTLEPRFEYINARLDNLSDELARLRPR